MEEKLINLVKNEFGKDFGIFTENDNTELHLVGRLCNRAFVVFTVAQEHNEYTLKPDIIETRFMTMKMLPKIKPLKTEEQVIALIKYTYQYLKDRYNNVK